MMRRPRFSLATLCIVSCICCALMGWLKWRIVAEERHRQAVRHLLERGHLLSKADFNLRQMRFLGPEKYLAGWVPPKKAIELQQLLRSGGVNAGVAISQALPRVQPGFFNTCKRALGSSMYQPRAIRLSWDCTDEDVICLGELSSLRTVVFENQPTVCEEFNDRLPKLKQLQHLSMEWTQLSKQTMESVSQLDGLETLNLDHTPVGDDGAHHLRNLSKLRQLSLNNTKLTDNGLHSLARIKGLRVLHVDSTDINDVGLAKLQGLVELRSLSISGTAVTVCGLRYLSRMTKLESLRIDQCNIGLNDAVRVLGIEQKRGVREAMKILGVLEVEKGIESLNFGGKPIVDEDLWVLDSVPDVQRIHLAGDLISDAGVRRLSRLKKLQRLQFSSPSITDASVESLAKVETLQHLFIVGTAISPIGVKRLRASLPNCTVLNSK